MDWEAVRYVYLRRVVGTAFGALGIDAASGVARRLARGVFDLNTPGRRRAEARLREALSSVARDAEITDADTPQETPKRRNVNCQSSIPNHQSSAVTIAAMYEHIGRFWTEALFARRLLRDSSWQRFVRIEGEAVLRSLAEARRGCVLATAYHGSPAVGAYALGQIFRPVHVIADTLAQPQLRAWQRELYSHRWIKPIDREDAGKTVSTILRNGGAVMMICEHERRRGKAVPTRFLGRTLNCYPTLGRLARWFDVPIGIVTCRREGSGGFSFVLELHATLEHGAAESDDGAVVRRVMATLERAVMRYPGQYLWSMPTMSAGGARKSDQAAIGTETESASSRTSGRTTSASRRPSAAGKSQESPAVLAAPAPTV